MTDTRRPLAVVTGGARGIGRATCLLLVRRGYDVACVYKSDSSAEQVKDMQKEILPIVGNGDSSVGRLHGFQCDVSDQDAVNGLFVNIYGKLGRNPKYLVNNAAGTGPTDERDIANMNKKDLDSVFATNVYGPFFCCREFVRQRRFEAQHSAGQIEKDDNPRKKRKVMAGGAIVNVTSGLMKLKGHPLFYAMSKGALDSMMVGLSKSLPASDGIRINSVAPGTTKTDLVSDERAEEVKDDVPMGRAGKPEEVAEAIYFLLSDASSYCSGSTLSLTGGR